ncbi:hypothetical protein SLS56_010498 [Neofusicoccum ribis]|uniref:Six-bladed beta-propeller-like protein n=1 Tax=Neofusicoccum ribis TaxID=45134 RepID=A0ABR3SE83_9PEZI
MLLITSILYAALPLGCVGAAIATQAGALNQVHQFPNGTSVENIAVRENGNLLVTLLYEAQILEINPTQASTGNSTANLVHYFNGSTRVNGISELTPDVFAVSANHDTIWTMDLSAGGDAQVSKIVTIANASFLNGVTTLDAAAGTVLVADSSVGLIWFVNTLTGEYSIALQDTTMAAVTIPSSGMSLGVNGARYRDGFVYYTNTGKQLFCRVQVDPATGSAVGLYETIAQGFAGDDLALSTTDDAAYVASGSSNVVQKIFFDGSQALVAGGANSTDVAGATSVVYGRTDQDSDVLYVTTSGGGVGGGKVMAVRV